MSLFSGSYLKIMRFIFVPIMIFCSIYIGLCVMAFTLQGAIIFHPRKRLQVDPGIIGLSFHDIWLRTTDDVGIHGWYIPSGIQGRSLLFFHGNAGNIAHRLDSIKIFHDLGLNILIIDYRGYGKSQGKPSEKGLYLDGYAAWNYLTDELDVPSRDIIVFGRSLGGSVAMDLASRSSPGGLILESSFSSLLEVGKKHFPFLPVKWILRHVFDISDKIKLIDCPVLVIHSLYDEIIPFSSGEMLFSGLREPKTFLEIEGDHNTGFLLSIDKYRQCIDKFIRSF